MTGLYYYDGSSPRPACRGVLHLTCALSSPAWGAYLLRRCNSSRALFGCVVFVSSLAYLFATSGTYHTYRWQDVDSELQMQRADHLGIHLVCFGSLVPAFLLLLGKHSSLITALHMVWVSVCIYLTVTEPHDEALTGGRYQATLNYVMSPLPGLVAALRYGLYSQLTQDEQLYLRLTGVQYLTGAFIYALESPNPFPQTFGFHEIFHMFVVGAATTTYLMNLSVVERCYEVHSSYDDDDGQEQGAADAVHKTRRSPSIESSILSQRIKGR